MNPRAIQAQARALRLALPNAGEPCIEPGKPWDVILDAAKRTNAALVVIGSRRLTGLHTFGSVSRRVVHDAACSVLVIPPGALTTQLGPRGSTMPVQKPLSKNPQLAQ